MKRPPSLVAAVLDDETADRLRVLAVHSNEFCHHVTIAWKPTPEVFARFERFIGTTIEFDVLSSYQDEKGQAAMVNGVPSLNDVPHVTISCAVGVAPVYSNLLFLNPQRRRTPLMFRGKATVRAW